mgnify:FL=1|tara:strand:+ start:94 stop:210 length:117 start_codon:yes stop_codon:yes gene_type:complete
MNDLNIIKILRNYLIRKVDDVWILNDENGNLLKMETSE